jgi:hypothetical protein
MAYQLGKLENADDNPIVLITGASTTMDNVEKSFSLDEAGKALDYLRDIHPRGKIVLAI